MNLTSRRSLAVVTLLGIALRLFHFLRNPSVWHDEAVLLVNVLHLDFTQLLGPLIWHEAAPPLFLWLERAVFLTIGDSTFALRLVPAMASCASMVLFVAAARRLLPPPGTFWAALLFAVSDRLLWHACEAKPYAIDVFLATAVLYCASCEWTRKRWLLVVALAAPVMIFVSFPACFLCGAALLFALPRLWREGSWRQYLSFAFAGFAVVGSFALLYFGPIHAQRTGSMEGCWVTHFPDWSRPWSVPLWSVASTFEVGRYCLQPIGNVLLPLACVGAWWFWRSGRRSWLILLIGPLVLAFVAALVKGYPFGGSRLEVFGAPAIVLLLAASVEPLSQWLDARMRYARVGLAGLLLVPCAFSLWFVVSPWPRADVAGAADYILSNRRPGDGISANHWEYAYYFRRERPDLSWLEHGIPPDSARVWVAFTAPDRVVRSQHGEHLASLGNIVSQREFQFTTVFLLERPGVPGPPVAQSTPRHSPP